MTWWHSDPFDLFSGDRASGNSGFRYQPIHMRVRPFVHAYALLSPSSIIRTQYELRGEQTHYAMHWLRMSGTTVSAGVWLRDKELEISTAPGEAPGLGWTVTVLNFSDVIFQFYRDVPNICFVFTSMPNSGLNSVFVFGRIVSS